MSSVAELKHAIQAYCNQYNLKLAAKLSEPYHLISQWADSFPNAASAGCYFIFDHNDALLYIGKASLKSTVGRRLSTYFYTSTDGATIGLRHNGWGDAVPIRIRTLAVKHSYEAPSLEEFLIAKLKPSHNTRI